MHRSPVLTAALAGALVIGIGTGAALAAGGTAQAAQAAQAAEPAAQAELAAQAEPASQAEPAIVAAEPVVLAAGPAAAQALAANAPDHDDPADHVWSESAVAAVTLTGSGATSTSSAVSISGSTVTVTAAGTYRFTGSLSNGRIVVNSAGTGLVRLILNGVTIANSATAPLSVTAADEVMVVLADGTTNRLTDPATYTTAVNPSAALSSAADLTITGAGALTVTGNAADGIASDDGLVIDSGTITVTAKDDGVRGQDYVVHTAAPWGSRRAATRSSPTRRPTPPRGTSTWPAAPVPSPHPPVTASARPPTSSWRAAA